MVCPALLPPWLRTITSALLGSASMIFPFPSSPHCAPTKIVFAISIQTSGKKFSGRIWQDAAGTCPLMIRTARLRASVFQARAISQKKTTNRRGACVGRLMRTILLLILILLLIGALPAWPYSTGWGYYPSGGLGLILLILIILALTGR